MPTYEFRCPDGHEFERFYKTISTAPSVAPCPECGAIGARQLSAGAGFSFKGSGFYLTDYGKNAHRGGPAPDAKGEGSDSQADTKSDSKADLKADSKSDKKADSKADSKAESKADSKADSKSNTTADTTTDKKADKKSENVKSKSEAPKSSKKKSE